MKLWVDKLTKFYGRIKVVDEVNLQLEEGEVVGLLGPNGAGKTTIFYMIAGLISPNSGKIFLNEEEITHLAMHKRAKLGMYYLPQEPSIFEGLTVEENLLAIVELTHQKREIVEELIKEFELTNIIKTKGYNLSGGERRRVEVARSLITHPKFLLLDEPFTGIDPIGVDTLQQLVIKLKHKNIGILITDHRVKELLQITDRAYIIYKGKILIEGDAARLIADEEAKRIYLGERFKI
jgi:lipopolysaccharide export system ATP-binding protein